MSNCAVVTPSGNALALKIISVVWPAVVLVVAALICRPGSPVPPVANVLSLVTVPVPVVRIVTALVKAPMVYVVPVAPNV